MPRAIVTVDDIRAVPIGGTFSVPHQAIVTDLARELLQARQITLVESQLDVKKPVFSPQGLLGPQDLPGKKTSFSQMIAIGSDHGLSFTMKEDLKPHLESLGYMPLDCGAYTPETVDYPDIAYAVAKQVADGKAWAGIIIDGAGIGSSIAANKIPGIRAALCYNQAMARNSREHNNANVLTLGAGMIGLNLARQIVTTWLQTEFGGGRHQRRVDKILEIEQRFLRG